MGSETSCCKSTKVHHSVIVKSKHIKEKKNVSIVVQKDQKTDKDQEESAKETVEGQESQAYKINGLKGSNSQNSQDIFLEQDKNYRQVVVDSYCQCQVIQETNKEHIDEENENKEDSQIKQNQNLENQPNSQQQIIFSQNSDNIINENPDIEYQKSNLIEGKVWQSLDQVCGGLLVVKTYTSQEMKDLRINSFIYKKLLKLQNENQHFCKYKDIIRNQENGIDIIMEYISGGSLVNLLTTFRRFNENLTQLFTRQILRALCELHEQGIAHCNLKCSNILVDQSGQIKISDVNIFEMNATCKEKLRSQYSAPEILLQQKFTTASDIWSIGCIIIEMMTGLNPWSQNQQVMSVTDITEMVQAEKLFQFPKKTNKQLKKFLTHIFRFEPDHRPSAKMLLEDIYLKEAAIEEQNLQNSIQINSQKSFSRSLSSNSEKKIPKFYNLSMSSIDEHQLQFTKQQQTDKQQQKSSNTLSMHIPTQKSAFSAFSKKNLEKSIEIDEQIDNKIISTQKIQMKTIDSINTNIYLNKPQPSILIDKLAQQSIRAPSLGTVESVESDQALTINDFKQYLSQNSSNQQIKSQLDAMKEAPEDKENDNFDENERRQKNDLIRQQIWKNNVYEEIGLVQPQEEGKNDQSIQQNYPQEQAKDIQQNQKQSLDNYLHNGNSKESNNSAKQSDQQLKKKQSDDITQAQLAEQKRKELERLMLEEMMKLSEESQDQINQQENNEPKEDQQEKIDNNNNQQEPNIQIQNQDKLLINTKEIQDFIQNTSNQQIDNNIQNDKSNKENDDNIQNNMKKKESINSQTDLKIVQKIYSSDESNTNERIQTPNWNKSNSNSFKLNQSDGVLLKKNDTLCVQKAYSLNNLETNHEKSENNKNNKNNKREMTFSSKLTFPTFQQQKQLEFSLHLI